MKMLRPLGEVKKWINSEQGVKTLNDLAELIKQQERKMIEDNKISYEDYTRPVTI